MMNDRWKNRASVAAMAAFAPKTERESTLPSFAERVEETPTDGGGDDNSALGGLSAQEQAEFDALREGGGGEPAGGDDAGDDGDPEPDGEGDGEGDDDEGAGAPGDREPAPAEPAAAAADAGGERKAKSISYGKHQREMAKATKARDEAQALLDSERTARARLEGRTQMLLDAMNAARAAPAAAAPAATAPTDPEPDADSDPIGHVQWENRQLRKRVDDLSDTTKKRDEATAAEAEEKEVIGTLMADIERAAAVDASAGEAFVYLRESRFKELGFIYAGIDISDTAQCALLTEADQKKLSDQIKQSFYAEQLLVTRQAMQAKQSPAKVVLNLARARGFVPGAAAPAAPAAPAAASAAAAAPAPAARAPAARPSVKDQLAEIRENQGASRSLSDAGGSPGGELTRERLEKMDDEEFAAVLQTMPKAKFDKLMGRVPE